MSRGNWDLRKHLRRLATAVTLTLGAAGAAHAIPSTLTVQGMLSNDAGNASDGDYDLTISLWTAETGGTQVFTQTLTGVAVSGGLFDLVLGADPMTPLTPHIFTSHA